MVVVVTSNMVVVVTSNMIVIVTSDIIFFVTLVVIAAVTSNVKNCDVKYDDGVRGSFRDVRLSMDQSTTVQRAITV